MKTIKVNTPSKSYNVISGSGAICELIPSLENSVGKCRLAVLTDDNVDSLFKDKLEGLFQAAGYSYIKYVIKNGEASKNPETLFAFLEFMASEGITRSDCVVAFGGGVVGDLAGFAASVYQRGIMLIQIPTTLLSMVDSSVGGKTAVDLKAGKNLAGSFWQPSAVICDTDFTKTLKKEVFRDGCAEVIKYGVILDDALFDKLGGGIENCLEYAVCRSIELKRDIVEGDERDTGMRAILNFGHTFGHAIEKLSNFSVSHGAAVAKGMVIAAKVARALGISDLTHEISGILLSYGFDLSCACSAKEIASSAMSDKKKAQGKLSLILPEKIGKCVIYPIPADSLLSLLEAVKL